MAALIDRTGHTFGRLTVISRGSNASDGEVRWLCKCECGNTTEVRSSHIRAEQVRSCGCLAYDNKSRKIGGLSTHHDYGRWCQMIKRCYDPNHKGYRNYGGRGITVCDKWRSSFAAFLQDMGPSPAGMTLERLDNDKGYSPENCRWATRQEQTENKRNNRMMIFNDKPQTITNVARQLGCTPAKLAYRLDVMQLPETLAADMGTDYRSQRRAS